MKYNADSFDDFPPLSPVKNCREGKKRTKKISDSRTETEKFDEISAFHNEYFEERTLLTEVFSHLSAENSTTLSYHHGNVFIVIEGSQDYILSEIYSFFQNEVKIAKSVVFLHLNLEYMDEECVFLLQEIVTGLRKRGFQGHGCGSASCEMSATFYRLAFKDPKILELDVGRHIHIEGKIFPLPPWKDFYFCDPETKEIDVKRTRLLSSLHRLLWWNGITIKDPADIPRFQKLYGGMQCKNGHFVSY